LQIDPMRLDDFGIASSHAFSSAAA
jgi:hypothetical protein